jgi:signal peptidase II
MSKFININKISLNIAIISLMAIFFSIDRYLKKFAYNLGEDNSYNLIGEFFTFTFAKNENIAFSLPLNERIIMPLAVLIIVSLVIFIFWLIFKYKTINTEIMLLTFVVLGAISNMLDRFQHEYVIDYLSIKNFSIFNIADVMISLGMIFYILINYKNNKKVRQNG